MSGKFCAGLGVGIWTVVAPSAWIAAIAAW
jgi:hypothetical protein